MPLHPTDAPTQPPLATAALRTPNHAARIMGCGLAVALALYAVSPNPLVMQWTGENGPVETATVVFYLAVAVLIWLLRDARDDTASWVALTIIVGAFGARELDLHKAWTTMSILKARFWTGGETPWTQRLGAFLVLLPVVWSMLRLLRRYGGVVWRQARQHHPVAMTAVTFVVCLVLVKLLDRSLDVGQHATGLTAPPWLVALEATIEETTEMLLPVLVGLGVFQARGLRLRREGRVRAD
jgi:hypothetical protein